MPSIVLILNTSNASQQQHQSSVLEDFDPDDGRSVTLSFLGCPCNATQISLSEESKTKAFANKNAVDGCNILSLPIPSEFPDSMSLPTVNSPLNMTEGQGQLADDISQSPQYIGKIVPVSVCGVEMSSKLSLNETCKMNNVINSEGCSGEGSEISSQRENSSLRKVSESSFNTSAESWANAPLVLTGSDERHRSKSPRKSTSSNSQSSQRKKSLDRGGEGKANMLPSQRSRSSGLRISKYKPDSRFIDVANGPNKESLAMDCIDFDYLPLTKDQIWGEKAQGDSDTNKSPPGINSLAAHGHDVKESKRESLADVEHSIRDTLASPVGKQSETEERCNMTPSVTLAHRSSPKMKSRSRGHPTMDKMFVDVMKILVTQTHSQNTRQCGNIEVLDRRCDESPKCTFEIGRFMCSLDSDECPVSEAFRCSQVIDKSSFNDRCEAKEVKNKLIQCGIQQEASTQSSPVGQIRYSDNVPITSVKANRPGTNNTNNCRPLVDDDEIGCGDSLDSFDPGPSSNGLFEQTSSFHEDVSICAKIRTEAEGMTERRLSVREMVKSLQERFADFSQPSTSRGQTRTRRGQSESPSFCSKLVREKISELNGASRKQPNCLPAPVTLPKNRLRQNSNDFHSFSLPRNLLPVIKDEICAEKGIKARRENPIVQIWRSLNTQMRGANRRFLSIQQPENNKGSKIPVRETAKHAISPGTSRDKVSAIQHRTVLVLKGDTSSAKSLDSKNATSSTAENIDSTVTLTSQVKPTNTDNSYQPVTSVCVATIGQASETTSQERHKKTDVCPLFPAANVEPPTKRKEHFKKISSIINTLSRQSRKFFATKQKPIRSFTEKTVLTKIRPRCPSPVTLWPKIAISKTRGQDGLYYATRSWSVSDIYNAADDALEAKCSPYFDVKSYTNKSTEGTNALESFGATVSETAVTYGDALSPIFCLRIHDMSEKKRNLQQMSRCHRSRGCNSHNEKQSQEQCDDAKVFCRFPIWQVASDLQESRCDFLRKIHNQEHKLSDSFVVDHKILTHDSALDDFGSTKSNVEKETSSQAVLSILTEVKDNSKLSLVSSCDTELGPIALGSVETNVSISEYARCTKDADESKAEGSDVKMIVSSDLGGAAMLVKADNVASELLTDIVSEGADNIIAKGEAEIIAVKTVIVDQAIHATLRARNVQLSEPEDTWKDEADSKPFIQQFKGLSEITASQLIINQSEALVTNTSCGAVIDQCEISAMGKDGNPRSETSAVKKAGEIIIVEVETMKLETNVKLLTDQCETLAMETDNKPCIDLYEATSIRTNHIPVSAQGETYRIGPGVQVIPIAAGTASNAQEKNMEIMKNNKFLIDKVEMESVFSPKTVPVRANDQKQTEAIQEEAETISYEDEVNATPLTLEQGETMKEKTNNRTYRFQDDTVEVETPNNAKILAAVTDELSRLDVHETDCMKTDHVPVPTLDHRETVAPTTDNVYLTGHVGFLYEKSGTEPRTDTVQLFPLFKNKLPYTKPIEEQKVVVQACVSYSDCQIETHDSSLLNIACSPVLMKTHSLVNAKEAAHAESVVTEVRALISKDVNIRRYLSFPNLTDINDEDGNILATKETGPIINNGLHPKASLKMYHEKLPMENEPMNFGQCILPMENEPMNIGQCILPMENEPMNIGQCILPEVALNEIQNWVECQNDGDREEDELPPPNSPQIGTSRSVMNTDRLISLLQSCTGIISEDKTGSVCPRAVSFTNISRPVRACSQLSLPSPSANCSCGNNEDLLSAPSPDIDSTESALRGKKREATDCELPTPPNHSLSEGSGNSEPEDYSCGISPLSASLTSGENFQSTSKTAEVFKPFSFGSRLKLLRAAMTQDYKLFMGEESSAHCNANMGVESSPHCNAKTKSGRRSLEERHLFEDSELSSTSSQVFDGSQSFAKESPSSPLPRRSREDQYTCETNDDLRVVEADIGFYENKSIEHNLLSAETTDNKCRNKAAAKEIQITKNENICLENMQEEFDNEHFSYNEYRTESGDRMEKSPESTGEFDGSININNVLVVPSSKVLSCDSAAILASGYSRGGDQNYLIEKARFDNNNSNMHKSDTSSSSTYGSSVSNLATNDTSYSTVVALQRIAQEMHPYLSKVSSKENCKAESLRVYRLVFQSQRRKKQSLPDSCCEKDKESRRVNSEMNGCNTSNSCLLESENSQRKTNSPCENHQELCQRDIPVASPGRVGLSHSKKKNESNNLGTTHSPKPALVHSLSKTTKPKEPGSKRVNVNNNVTMGFSELMNGKNTNKGSTLNRRPLNWQVNGTSTSCSNVKENMSIIIVDPKSSIKRNGLMVSSASKIIGMSDRDCNLEEQVTNDDSPTLRAVDPSIHVYSSGIDICNSENWSDNVSTSDTVKGSFVPSSNQSTSAEEISELPSDIFSSSKTSEHKIPENQTSYCSPYLHNEPSAPIDLSLSTEANLRVHSQWDFSQISSAACMTASLDDIPSANANALLMASTTPSPCTKGWPVLAASSRHVKERVGSASTLRQRIHCSERRLTNAHYFVSRSQKHVDRCNQMVERSSRIIATSQNVVRNAEKQMLFTAQSMSLTKHRSCALRK